jgi:hypothetical protein
MADGEIYAVESAFEDHPQGRCTPVPLVEGARELTWQSGENWLTEQDSAMQLRMMGPTRYTLWQEGQIALQDMKMHIEDDVWGGAWVPRPVNQLINRGTVDVDNLYWSKLPLRNPVQVGYDELEDWYNDDVGEALIAWTENEWEALGDVSRNFTQEWLAENEDYLTDMYVAIDEAMSKAKPYRGEVWRGLTGLSDNDFADMASLKVGDNMSLRCIQSGTADEAFVGEWIDLRAGNDADSVILHIIDNKSGVLIQEASVYPEQAEVLLRKDAVYAVQEMARNEENILTISLEEITEIAENW